MTGPTFASGVASVTSRSVIRLRCETDAAPLGIGKADGYFNVVSTTAHRAFVLVVILALIVGLGSNSVRAADLGTNLTFVSAAADVLVPSKSNGCGTALDVMPQATCYAFCGSMVQVMACAIDVPVLNTLLLHAEPILTGHVNSPDPHPPRPVVFG